MEIVLLIVSQKWHMEFRERKAIDELGIRVFLLDVVDGGDLWTGFMQKLFCSLSRDPATLVGGRLFVWTQAPAIIPAPLLFIHPFLQLADGMSGLGRTPAHLCLPVCFSVLCPKYKFSQ